MRLSVLLILIAVLSSTASVYSQATRLTVKMENARLSQVFDAIEKQSEFYFFYNRDYFNDDRIVSVDVENKLLDEVLKELFKNEPITYEIFDRNILLTIPEASLTTAQREAIQQPAVSGTVTDESGQPLPGVTVVVKGTTQGTVTNSEGEYTLTNFPEDATLVFSFVGMRTQEVEPGNQTLINVTMVMDAIGIEEVVAIGYGTMKKSDLTGSVASVKSENVNAFPTTNVLQALSGRAAGVQVLQGTGEPGGSISVRIRGTNSIRGSNEPLYVIDGFPTSGSNPTILNNLDIESIEILKDASATAIYGSRGANGVVLITTKSGIVGKTSVHLESNYGIQSIRKKMEMMNAREYLEFYNMAWENAGLDPLFTQEEINSAGEGFDWQDFVFRNALIQNHSISVEGGNEKNTIFNIRFSF